MRAILSLFGKSPFKPLQAHMVNVKSCVERMPPLVTAVLDGNSEVAQKLTGEIFELESEADAIKDDIRNHLPKSIFLPIDRRDLLEILHVQDSMADMCQDIASTLLLRELKLLPELRKLFEQLLAEVVKVCLHAADIIDQLDELLHMSFGGHEAAKVLKMVEELNETETITDKTGTQVAKMLFSLEGEMSPVEILLWFRIFRQVGDLANRAENLGNCIRLFVAK